MEKLTQIAISAGLIYFGTKQSSPGLKGMLVGAGGLLLINLIHMQQKVKPPTPLPPVPRVPASGYTFNN